MRRLVLSLAFSLSVVGIGCPSGDGPSPAASSSAATVVEHPGWLNNNEREILKLQTELANNEPKVGERYRIMLRALADAEQSRLPKAWVDAARTAATLPDHKASVLLWNTLATDQSLTSPMNDACAGGQPGLEALAQLVKPDGSRSKDTPRTLASSVFKTCGLAKLGLADAHEGLLATPMVFAAVAARHLKKKDILSPEELAALRAFVSQASAQLKTKRIRPRRPQRAPVASAASASASSATASPSATP